MEHLESLFLEPIYSYPSGLEVFKIRNIHGRKNLNEFLKINVVYGSMSHMLIYAWYRSNIMVVDIIFLLTSYNAVILISDFTYCDKTKQTSRKTTNQFTNYKSVLHIIFFIANI